jgi:hypothetical protein
MPRPSGQTRAKPTTISQNKKLANENQRLLQLVMDVKEANARQKRQIQELEEERAANNKKQRVSNLHCVKSRSGFENLAERVQVAFDRFHGTLKDCFGMTFGEDFYYAGKEAFEIKVPNTVQGRLRYVYVPLSGEQRPKLRARSWWETNREQILLDGWGDDRADQKSGEDDSAGAEVEEAQTVEEATILSAMCMMRDSIKMSDVAYQKLINTLRDLKLCQLPSLAKMSAFRQVLNELLGSDVETRPTVGMNGVQVRLLPFLRKRVQEAVTLALIRPEALSQLQILIQGDGSSFSKSKGCVMIGIKILNIDHRTMHQVQNFHPVMLLDGFAHAAVFVTAQRCSPYAGV